MLQKLKRRRPSPAMIVAVMALVVALDGTAYAAGQINGNSIQKQSIGGGKLKKKTLTGYQINVGKLGEVPLAKRTTHTFWAVVHNPAGPGNATLTRSSDTGAISATEAGGAVDVIFPINVSDCANVAGRNNDGTSAPVAGYAQTNISPANPNAIEVHTKDKSGNNEDSDFNLIVICP
ncbi:MAG TPA: hypothetical protein VH299_00305 [Solirubrobacterales bacterium]|jgi:hypothetical protein|nr:hypothetical protein [Solirubrobacterales bacterium]